MAWQRGSATALLGAPEAAPPPAGRLAIFSSLRYRDYRLFWFAMMCSVLGQHMEWITLAWLVLQLTNSPLSIGLTGLSQALPTIALSFVGGAIADRVDRRRLLMLTQGTIALLYLFFASLVTFGAIQVWQVPTFAFILGCVRAFDQPTRQALLPQLIPREELANAVAVANFVWQLPRLVGPAAAGLLIASVGVGPTLYVASAGFFVALALFSLVRSRQTTVRTREANVVRDILEGLEFIRRNQVFCALIGLVFFDSVFGMSYTMLLPVLARDFLRVGSQGYGFLQTVAAVGAIVGTIFVASRAQSGHRGWLVLTGAMAFGVLLIGLALSPWFLLSMGLMFLIGVTNHIYMIAISTLLQLHLSDEFRARVMGVYGLTWGLIPLGGTVAGAIAEFHGAPTAVALGGTLVTCAALFMAVALPRVRRL